jgi:hypothetical protein
VVSLFLKQLLRLYVKLNSNNNFVLTEGLHALPSDTYHSPPSFPSELKSPALMYTSASEIGAIKASLPAWKIFLSGIVSGCHIAFGAFLVLSVGGACPELARTFLVLSVGLLMTFGNLSHDLSSASPLATWPW